MTSWLGKWDARACCGLDVWEFSVRSLRHAYGRFFLRDIILRHPWHAWNGLRTYAKIVRSARQPGLAPVLVRDEADFCQRVATGPWLLALGFCEKPTTPPCPAGRFNHDCAWLIQDRPPSLALPPPCQNCHFCELSKHALLAGASLHVMTSAHDIARDILLPGLRGPSWKGLLLCVCPFSIAPISLAMTLCQLPGLVLSYASGDCQDYQAWLQADIGIKPERTIVASATHQKMIALLDAISARRRTEGLSPAIRYRARGHFFDPDQ